MYSLLIASIFLLQAYQGLAQTCGSCPSGFTYFPEVNKCYKAFPTKQTWDQALLTCQNLNSHLATVIYPCSNNALKTIFNTIKSQCMNPDLDKPTFWSAGRRKCNNGSFAWVPNRGTMLDVTYTNWLKGEPNNIGGNEDCLHILNNDNKDLLWNDSVCSKPNCFVCQIDL